MTKNTGDGDRLLDLPAVLRRVPVGRSTIYEWRRDGIFPQGRKVGLRRRFWTETEIDSFIAGRNLPVDDQQ